MRFVDAILLGVLGGAFAAEAGNETSKGAVPVLPEIILTKLNGETFDLSSLVTNKPVYIKFWATWCLQCIEQMPHFQKSYETYGEKIDFLAINVGINNDEDDIRRFLDRRPFDIPIVIDKEALAARALGVVGTPFHVLIDGDGTIVHTGHEADDTVDGLLEGMAAGKTYDVAGTVDTGAANLLNVNVIGGESMSLQRLVETGPAALVFTATWCESYWEESQPDYTAACKAQRQALDQAHLKYGKSLKTVGLLSHYYTTDKEAADYAKDYNIAYPVAVDQAGDIARKYGVTQMPTVVLLDKLGRVLAKTSGGADAVLPAYAAAAKAIH